MIPNWAKGTATIIAGTVAVLGWLRLEYVQRLEYEQAQTVNAIAVEAVKGLIQEKSDKSRLDDMRLRYDQDFTRLQEAAASLEYLQRMVRDNQELNPVQKDRLGRLEKRLP